MRRSANNHIPDVLALVAEDRLPDIYVGQPATIYARNLSRSRLPATVRAVASLPVMSAESTRYAVMLTAENPDELWL